MTSRGMTPQHRAVRDAVAAYVRQHGRKRGLQLAAEAIGIGERAARHAHEGTWFAADADRAVRADAARLDLLRQQIAQLRAEADEIERERKAAGDAHGLVGVVGAALHRAVGVGRGSRKSGFPARAAGEVS